MELCNLWYDPQRGAAIDPHKDDAWLWGERLVTLNLLTDTAYSMHHESAEIKLQKPVTANEDSAPLLGFSAEIPCSAVKSLDSFSAENSSICESKCVSDVIIRIRFPRRSLIVLYGDARYTWLHSIRSCDVTEQRLGITLRELSGEFQDGGEREGEGTALLEQAETFAGVSVLERKMAEI